MQVKKRGVKKTTNSKFVQPKLSKASSDLSTKKKNNDTEEQEEVNFNQVLVSSTEHEYGTEYRIYVNSMAPCEFELLDKYYAPAIETIINATESDVIRYRIASPGGWDETFMMFYSAMLRSDATFIADIVSTAYSAASALALVCDDIEVHPLSKMMIHVGESAHTGIIPRKVDFQKFELEQEQLFFSTIYADFLTPSEIELALSGKELWIGAEEILERWNKVQEKRQAEQAEAIKEAHEEQLPQLIEIIEKQGYTVAKKKKVEK